MIPQISVVCQVGACGAAAAVLLIRVVKWGMSYFIENICDLVG